MPLNSYTVTHPKLCVKTVLADSLSTGPFERYFGKLAKICCKDRNSISSKNLESLYILAVLKETVMNITRAREILEKK